MDSSINPAAGDQARAIIIKVSDQVKPSNADLAEFQQLWETKANADLNITCHKSNFLVHKRVLAARSSVFAIMFKNEFQVRSEASILDTKPSVLGAVIEWMYTNKMANFYTMKSKELCGLIELADKYELDELKLFGLSKLFDDLSLSSIADVLKITSVYDVPEQALTKLAVFCQKNFDQLLTQSRFCDFIQAHSIYSTVSPEHKARVEQEHRLNKSLKRKWNLNYKDECDKKKFCKAEKRAKNESESEESEYSEYDDEVETEVEGENEVFSEGSN